MAIAGAKKDAGLPEGARAKRGLLNHYNETAGHGMQRCDGGSGIARPKAAGGVAARVRLMKNRPVF